MIQEIIVGAAIVLAVVYLAYRIRKSFTQKGGCNCGSGKNPDCPYSRDKHHKCCK